MDLKYLHQLLTGFVLLTLATTVVPANMIIKPHTLTYAIKVDFGFSVSGVMVQTLSRISDDKWQFKHKANALGLRSEESSTISTTNSDFQSLSYSKNDVGFSSNDTRSFTISQEAVSDPLSITLRIGYDLNNGVNIEKKPIECKEILISFQTIFCVFMEWKQSQRQLEPFTH